jgi:hypothetical protein
MSRKNFSLDRKWRNVFWLPGPVPCARRSVLRSCPMVLGYCSISAGSSSFSSDDADRFLKLASAAVACWRPRISLRLRLSAFPVCPRGHRDSQKLSAFGTYTLQATGTLTLEPGRLQNRLTATRKRSPEMEDCERTPISVRNSLFPRSQVRLSRIWVSAFFLLRRSISPSLLAIKCAVKGAGLQ